MTNEIVISAEMIDEKFEMINGKCFVWSTDYERGTK